MKPLALWLGSIALGVVALGVSVPGAMCARSKATAQVARLSEVKLLVDQINQRAERPAVEADDSTSLSERLAESVSSVGLAKGVLLVVNPGHEEPLVGGLVRQRASVSLGSLTLRDLGRLLDHWRRAQPVWVASGIDLAPEGKSKAEPGGDLPLRVSLTLERIARGAER